MKTLQWWRGSRKAGLVFFAFCAFQASGISRVGTGRIGDSALGFEATIPKVMQVRREFVGGVELEGVVARARAGTSMLSLPRRVIAQVYSFGSEYPEWEPLSRDELAEAFKVRGWMREDSQNPCIDRYVVRNANVVTRIAAWGKGRGIVLVSQTADDRIEQGQIEMLASIELKDASCQW